MNDQSPASPRPAGTVYGRGSEQDRSSPLPRIAVAAVGVGAVAVLLLGYVAWNSTTGTTRPDTPAAAATPPPAVPSEEPSPVPAELSTGDWLLESSGARLGVDGDYAAMTDDDPAVLTVVDGLADGACFSFRLADGRYLRHFDYRLRFDGEKDEDLFRQDATFCPEAGRLHSKNYPEHVLHVRGTELYIDKPDGSGEFTAASTFTVRPPA